MQHSLFDEPDPTPGELCQATALLGLLNVPGVGPAKALQIARVFPSWDALRSATDVELAAVASKASADLRVAAAVDDLLLPDGVRVVGYFDHDFPATLRTIPSPPAVLWVAGTVPAERSIAIVGTRHPDRRCLDMAHDFAMSAVGHGWGVVSGLALGVDAAAHQGALDAGGATWAFLGSGVNVPTPASHRDLAHRMIEAGGGLLSEVPLGSDVSSAALIARNRLQSGATKATVIMQSGIPSGTLHTARFAIEQDRKLLVVAPDSIEAAHLTWAGNAALIAPQGCDPKILHARGRLATQISTRRPAADAVLNTVADLENLLDNRLEP